MSNAAKHTPTPWAVESDNSSPSIYVIQDWEAQHIHPSWNCVANIWSVQKRQVQEANAAFIVQACNAHDDLVEALKYATSEIEEFYKAAVDGRIKTVISIGQFGRLYKCHAALAKAGVE